MSIELDHLMWGAPSLDSGMAEAERLFGVAAAPGGVHPGLGTRNALLSLGGHTYLEIIAPDPEQDLAGTLGGRLATLAEPGLITWAARAPGLAALAGRAEKLGLGVRGPVPTTRAAPDGSTLSWELLFLGGHPFGSLLPFFIDWLDTPHPAATNPLAGSFQRLEIRTPDADPLNRLFGELGLSLRAEEGVRAELSAVVGTDHGPVRLDSARGAEGWSF